MDALNDILTLEEAAAFLKTPIHRLGYAVISGDLPCGLIARNWTGIAIPTRKDIPRGDKGHQWTSVVVEILDHDKPEYLYEYRLTGTDVSYRIRKAWLAQFWYLQHTDAYHLFAVTRDGIDVKFLAPVDGAFNHRTQPDRYCEPDFTVFVDDASLNRRVTLQDVLFLRRDLEKLRATKTPAQLTPKAEGSVLLILAAMLAHEHGMDWAEQDLGGIAKHLRESLALKGCQLPMDDRTLEKHLKRAALKMDGLKEL